jgi:hypothetical protein
VPDLRKNLRPLRGGGEEREAGGEKKDSRHPPFGGGSSGLSAAKKDSRHPLFGGGSSGISAVLGRSRLALRRPNPPHLNMTRIVGADPVAAARAMPLLPPTRGRCRPPRCCAGACCRGSGDGRWLSFSGIADQGLDFPAAAFVGVPGRVDDLPAGRGSSLITPTTTATQSPRVFSRAGAASGNRCDAG